MGDLSKYLSQNINWTATRDAEHPFVATVDGLRLIIRVNDFPSEELYSLIVDGREINFDDWPTTWVRKPTARSRGVVTKTHAQLKTYEVMYIIDPDTAADPIEKLNNSVHKLIEKEGGTVVRMDDIGLKNLAYPIQKKVSGHYVLFEIDGTGKEIDELEHRLSTNENIMRYITVRVDEDRKEAEKIRAKRRQGITVRGIARRSSRKAEGSTRLFELLSGKP